MIHLVMLAFFGAEILVAGLTGVRHLLEGRFPIRLAWVVKIRDL